MIRFIDLREQDTGGRFAFYNTVVDGFITANGVQVWKWFLDFEGDCEDKPLIERCRRLIPDWAVSYYIDGLPNEPKLNEIGEYEICKT